MVSPDKKPELQTTWDFKTIDSSRPGELVLTPLSLDQQAKIPQYKAALLYAASSSVARPVISGYHVHESIGGPDMGTFPAGNVEYGLGNALHGEECSVGAFLSQQSLQENPPLKDLVLGILAGEPGNIGAPCGNCRDIMLQTFDRELEIVSGSLQGRTAIVTTLSDYLYPIIEQNRLYRPDDLPNIKLSEETLQEHILETMAKGQEFIHNPYVSQTIFPERHYAAMLASEKAEYFGAHDIMSDYHPMYAGRDALRQMRRNHDPYLSYALFVVENVNGRPPEVMYQDRQHLLELNLQTELLKGNDQDPPVILATVNPNDKTITVWKTTVKSWLPFPFSPRSFGDEFIEDLKQYYLR